MVEMDLIISEFKLHKECRKILTRTVRLQRDTTRDDPIVIFVKLVSHIEWHVIGLNNLFGMGKAVKLYLGLILKKQVVKPLKIEDKRKKETFRLWTEKETFRIFWRRNFSFTNTYWYSRCNNKFITFVKSIYDEQWLWSNCYNCC